MELLKTLGVNSTIWYQLGLLVITFTVLSQLIFRPYVKALDKRHKLTVGGESDAAKILAEAHDVELQYELKAKQINSDIRVIFDKARETARKEQERTLTEARKNADVLLGQSRERLGKVVSETKAALDREVAPLSLEISKKLLGKDTL